MRGIKKETSRTSRNRNQYLHVRSTGPGFLRHLSYCDKWLSRKIPGAALWTSSSRTAWRRPRWIVFLSEPFLGDQNWRNPRERGLDCMEGDRESPTWITARVPWLCWPYEALHCRGTEWPHEFRNHSLLHTQWYCHRFAHSKLRLVSFERLQLVSFSMPLIQ